jgi:hypothetical protein
MFGTTLAVSTQKKMTPGQAAKAKSNADTIIWNRNNRSDIDTKGYKAYLYHLKKVSDNQDKEYDELIISAIDMDSAIDTFNSACMRGDYYEGAEFNITLMGVDFETTRTDKIVMAV